MRPTVALVPSLLIALSLSSLACKRDDSDGSGSGKPTSPATFERTYTHRGLDEAWALATVDGGYLIAGNAAEAGEPAQRDWKFFVTRVSTDGEQSWSATDSGNAIDAAAGIVVLPDGRAVVVGDQGGGSKRRPAAAMVSPAGEVVWSKKYDREGRGEANGIARLADGTLVVVGTVEQPGNAADLVVWSLSERGELEGLVQQGSPGRDTGDAIVAADGGFAVAGSVQGGDEAQSDAWVLRFRGRTVAWERKFPLPAPDMARALAPDGEGLVVAGAMGGKGWVAWLGADGAVTHEYTAPDFGRLFTVVAGEGLTMAGGRSNRDGEHRAWVLGFDAAHEVVVDRTYAAGRTRITAAVRAPDGGVAHVGKALFERTDLPNTWLCKLDAKLTGCGSS